MERYSILLFTVFSLFLCACGGKTEPSAQTSDTLNNPDRFIGESEADIAAADSLTFANFTDAVAAFAPAEEVIGVWCHEAGGQPKIYYVIYRKDGMNWLRPVYVEDTNFRVADDKGLLLLDLKDLRAMTLYVSEHAAEYRVAYGNVTEGSIGAIQRALLSLENQGADKFFGEPAFDIFDLLQTNNGKGIMSVLAADKLMQNPKLYSTFLLWLLSDIYARLPEVGDMELPKFVFFFDEAHTLFQDTSKALVDKIEQVRTYRRRKSMPLDWPCCHTPIHKLWRSPCGRKAMPAT